MAISITVKFYRSPIVPNLQSYDLKVVAESATDMPKEIFILQRRIGGASPGSSVPEDVFTCIADPVDLEEIPVGAPDLNHEMPYYRVAEITLRFRSTVLLEECKNLMDEDIRILVDSLKSAQDVELIDEVVYA
jgi:hypothetical protein